MSLSPLLHPRWTSPAAMAEAARYVEREYGETGYAIATEAASGTGKGVFRVSHFDGSEFRIMADRYGNVWRLPDLDDLADAVREGVRTFEAEQAARFARIDAELAS